MSQDNDVHGLDELLGAYALDAVDDDERERIEDYLTINPRAAAEVAEHREVATMLAYTGMSAPDSVWDRIEREIGESERAPAPGPELAQVIGLDAATGSAGSRRRVDRSRPWVRPTAWVASMAAAAAIAVVAVGVVDRSSDTSDDPVLAAFEDAAEQGSTQRTELVAEGSSASATGLLGENGTGYVDARGLPTLSTDETYQLWGVLAATGDVVSMGIMGADPGIATFTAEGEVAALAITIERAPGVVSDGNPDGAYVGEFG